MDRDQDVHPSTSLATVVNGLLELDSRRKRSPQHGTLSPGTSDWRAGGLMSQFRAKL